MGTDRSQNGLSAFHGSSGGTSHCAMCQCRSITAPGAGTQHVELLRVFRGALAAAPRVPPSPPGPVPAARVADLSRADEDVAVEHAPQAHVRIARYGERRALQHQRVDVGRGERVQRGRDPPEPQLVVVPRLPPHAPKPREIGGMPRALVDERAGHQRQEVHRPTVPERVEVDLFVT